MFLIAYIKLYSIYYQRHKNVYFIDNIMYVHSLLNIHQTIKSPREIASILRQYANVSQGSY